MSHLLPFLTISVTFLDIFCPFWGTFCHFFANFPPFCPFLGPLFPPFFYRFSPFSWSLFGHFSHFYGDIFVLFSTFLSPFLTISTTFWGHFFHFNIFLTFFPHFTTIFKPLFSSFWPFCPFFVHITSQQCSHCRHILGQNCVLCSLSCSTLAVFWGKTEGFQLFSVPAPRLKTSWGSIWGEKGGKRATFCYCIIWGHPQSLPPPSPRKWNNCLQLIKENPINHRKASMR